MRSLLNTLGALALAFFTGAIAMFISGYSPIASYRALLITPFSDYVYLASSLAI